MRDFGCSPAKPSTLSSRLREQRWHEAQAQAQEKEEARARAQARAAERFHCDYGGAAAQSSEQRRQQQLVEGLGGGSASLGSLGIHRPVAAAAPASPMRAAAQGVLSPARSPSRFSDSGSGSARSSAREQMLQRLFDETARSRAADQRPARGRPEWTTWSSEARVAAVSQQSGMFAAPHERFVTTSSTIPRSDDARAVPILAQRARGRERHALRAAHEARVEASYGADELLKQEQDDRRVKSKTRQALAYAHAVHRRDRDTYARLGDDGLGSRKAIAGPVGQIGSMSDIA
eukprot:g6805.t1